MRASSSSWRSSLRGSRSPMHGSRNRRSSPSRAAARGKAPSSSPSRQITRCGTDRIGTSVQTVSAPVRKFARVGRPASRSRSSSRISAGATSTADVPASRARPSEDPVQLGSLPRVAGPTSVSASAASATAAAQALIGCAVPRAVRASSRRSSSSANRPARSMSPESTSSSGSVPARGAASCSAVAVPSSMRSSPARHVPSGTTSSLNRSRCCGLQAPADARVGDPALEAAEVVVVETEAPADRLAVREVEDRRGGHPFGDEVQQRARPCRARGSSALTARSARRTRSPGGRSSSRPPSVSSSTRPAPNVAEMSGAKSSMSGHMTRTSRGSSVGSSARRPRTQSRSTSTWRARPWQAWTCTLRSPAARGSGASGGASSRTWRWRRPRSVVAGSSTAWCSDGVAGPSSSCSSRTSRPHEASSGCRGTVSVASSPAATHVGRQLGEPGPEHGGGVQEQQVQLAPVGERPQDVEVGGGQAGQAEEAQPVGQVDEPRLLAQACARLLGPRGRMRHVGEPPSQQIPQARLPQEVRWQREAVRVDRVAFRPGGDHPRAVAGVTVEQHGQPPSDAETAGLRLRRALEVAPEGPEPVLLDVGVDHLGERPGDACPLPRILERVDARRTRHGIGDDRAWGGEADVRADPRAQGELLGHPPLDPAGRNRDHIGSERVLAADVLGQFVDEAVGALGAMDDQHRHTTARTMP